MSGTTSVPSDPAAETMPSTLLRCLSETARAQAVIANEDAVHDSATADQRAGRDQRQRALAAAMTPSPTI